MKQISQLDVSIPDPESPETPGDPAETSDDDREWRPEYEVPPEPDDLVVTRRRVVAKRPPTTAEEELRQKRMRSESVSELFPLTGEELSEDVFEMLINLFASPDSEHRQDSRGSQHRQCCRVPEAHVYTRDRDRARPLKRRVEVPLRKLTLDDRDAFTAAQQKEYAS